MSNELRGKRVAILVADGFEQMEMIRPREALDAAGAITRLISPARGEVQGFNHHQKGDRFYVDVALKSADAGDYDALLLPGGVANPDHLRMRPEAVEFVKSFFKTHKPVAAICHAPRLLLVADVVRGRRMTSWPSLEADLKKAGAQWVDETVVTDNNLVTSRKPDDIPAFIQKTIEVFQIGALLARSA
jgi:protease I